MASLSSSAVNNSAKAYVDEYLSTHSLSVSSYRYIAILWLILISLAILHATAHQLRWSGGRLSMAYNRWGMKRIVLGSTKVITRNQALPSNTILLIFVTLTVVNLILCLAGPDYIAPSLPIFSRQIPTAPIGSINKSFWTSAARFGDISFALFPLVILFALKAPPFAFLATRFFTQLAWDKLIVLHRLVGWLIYGLTTMHVLLWTVQLAKDRYEGRAMFFAVWTSGRFVAGMIGYAALTGLMVFSHRSIRKNRFDVFYIAHIILVLLTLIFAGIHHPPLCYWMIVAGGLWLGERIFRLLRMARTNKFGTVKAKVPAIRPFPPVPMRSKQPVEGYRFSNLSDTTLTAPKQHSSGGQALTYRELPDVQTDRLTSPSTAILMSDCTSHKYGQSQFSSTDFDSGSVMTRPLLEPPPPIPAGYAQAQLLPSDTIRLTIKVAKPFIWSPGQSLSLCLPDLAPFQSHPFTIVNNDPSGIMLLIKARKGLTRKLYNWVWKHRQRYLEQNGLHQNRQPIGSTPSGESVLQVPPVHLRAIIDGPFGSSSRVTWGDYSTVVIFCGGSGVSFGGSILEYICGQLSQIGTSTSPRFKTRRLRFCWVVREYAEIAWIASHLRRCHLMVLPEQVQIEIFVTRKPTSISRTDELRRPRLSRTRSDSAITEMTDDETATYINEEHHITPFPLVSPTGSAPTTYLDPFDLTNYDDEADVEDLEQLRLSSQIEQEGKLRRAQSRQAARSPLPQILKAGPLASPPQRKRTPVPSPDAREHLLPPDLRLMPPPLGTPRPESRLSPLPSAPEPSYDPFDDDHGLRSPRSDTLSLPKASRAGSSVTPSIFGDDVEFSAGTTSGRDMQLLSRATRTRGVVALDTAERDLTGVETAKTLWLDEADFAAMSVLSEVAHTGRPQLDALIEQELLTAEGDVIVATCGPTTLDTVVRNSVSMCTSPERMRRGGRKFRVDIYSEDYES